MSNCQIAFYSKSKEAGPGAMLYSPFIGRFDETYPLLEAYLTKTSEILDPFSWSNPEIVAAIVVTLSAVRLDSDELTLPYFHPTLKTHEHAKNFYKIYLNPNGKFIIQHLSG